MSRISFSLFLLFPQLEVWKESQTTAFAHIEAAFAAVGESWGQVRMAVHEFTSGNIETLK